MKPDDIQMQTVGNLKKSKSMEPQQNTFFYSHKKTLFVLNKKHCLC